MPGLNRGRIAVMVPGAQTMGGLGVIRSLGTAGYIVHAVSSSPDALGLRSKLARHSTIHPAVTDPTFASWFERYVGDHDIRLIIPGAGISPGSHPVFARYPHLFPIDPRPEILALAGKYDLFAALNAGEQCHRANLPPFRLVDLDDELPSERDLQDLGPPLFIKLDEAHSTSGSGAGVHRYESASAAAQFLAGLCGKFRKALVQGFVPGKGAGAFLLRWNDRTLARFMHLRLHEMPHTGGASSLRKSWWHDAMVADAESKLERIGWRGVGMVEYRWDPSTDRFYLMEMNLRFWGSLHLALYAGVDFPRLLADAFFGEVPAEIVTGRLGTVCRNTIPYEIGYLVSLWRDPAVPVRKKLHSLIEAAALSVDPRVRSDLWFPGDRALYFIRMGAFARSLTARSG